MLLYQGQDSAAAHLHRLSLSTQSHSDSETNSPRMDAPGRTSLSENNGHSWAAEGLPATECRTNPPVKERADE